MKILILSSKLKLELQKILIYVIMITECRNEIKLILKFRFVILIKKLKKISVGVEPTKMFDLS